MLQRCIHSTDSYEQPSIIRNLLVKFPCACASNSEVTMITILIAKICVHIVYILFKLLLEKTWGSNFFNISKRSFPVTS